MKFVLSMYYRSVGILEVKMAYRWEMAYRCVARLEQLIHSPDTYRSPP